MKLPTSIRSWASWPSTATVPAGYHPIVLAAKRPTAGLPRPLVIGHRGARGLAPENTLLAVREALAAGVDMIEIDVWHIDGELVVMHDQRVDRTTNGLGYVQDFSLHDLRMLDAGCGQRVPLLEEVIELVDGRCSINIELKGPDCADAAVEAVNAALRTERWQREQFLLSSFDHPQLARVRQLDKHIRTGLLLTGVPYDLASYVQQLGVSSVHFSVDLVRPEWIATVQALGLWAFAYTVNDSSDLAWLQNMNIDGVFTDYPDAILSQQALAAVPQVA